MAHIVFAWELGSELGHLTRIATLAKAFHQRGHHITCILRELHKVELAMGDQCPYTILQAPLHTTQHKPSRAPVTYTEVLQCYGYANPAHLRYLYRAWQSLYQLLAPDLLICNYAPSALLAAQHKAFAKLQIGTGFFVPPTCSPLPVLRQQGRVDASALAATDRQVLGVINTVLTSEKHTPLKALHHSWRSDSEILFTHKALDPYLAWRNRDEHAPTYWGCYTSTATHTSARWQSPKGKRIFAYLKPNYRHLPALLATLLSSDCEVHAFIPDVDPTLKARFNNTRIFISHTPYDLNKAAAECDLLICHAGHGTICQALSSGCPILAIPLQVEQLILANTLSDMEVALAVNTRDDIAAIKTKIDTLLTDKRYHTSAQKLSKNLKNKQGKQPQPARFIDHCETLLKNHNTPPGPKAIDS